MTPAWWPVNGASANTARPWTTTNSAGASASITKKASWRRRPVRSVSCTSSAPTTPTKNEERSQEKEAPPLPLPQQTPAGRKFWDARLLLLLFLPTPELTFGTRMSRVRSLWFVRSLQFQFQRMGRKKVNGRQENKTWQLNVAAGAPFFHTGLVLVKGAPHNRRLVVFARSFTPRPSSFFFPLTAEYQTHKAPPGGATSKKLDSFLPVLSHTSGAAWRCLVFCLQLSLSLSLCYFFFSVLSTHLSAVFCGFLAFGNICRHFPTHHALLPI